jgi:hypothetical protein
MYYIHNLTNSVTLQMYEKCHFMMQPVYFASKVKCKQITNSAVNIVYPLQMFKYGIKPPLCSICVQNAAVIN